MFGSKTHTQAREATYVIQQRLCSRSFRRLSVQHSIQHRDESTSATRRCGQHVSKHENTTLVSLRFGKLIRIFELRGAFARRQRKHYSHWMHVVTAESARAVIEIEQQQRTVSSRDIPRWFQLRQFDCCYGKRPDVGAGVITRAQRALGRHKVRRS